MFRSRLGSTLHVLTTLLGMSQRHTFQHRLGSCFCRRFDDLFGTAFRPPPAPVSVVCTNRRAKQARWGGEPANAWHEVRLDETTPLALEAQEHVLPISAALSIYGPRESDERSYPHAVRWWWW